MGISSNQTVINELKEFINSGGLKKAQKSNSEFAKSIEELSPEQIYFGEKPSYIEGYCSGNCTAVGQKNDDKVESTRTISFNFETGSYTFIDNKTDTKLGKYAHKIFRKGIDLHKPSECNLLAEEYGKKLARQELWDLNFSMKEYRLNRFSFNKEGEYSLPVWPIYARINDKSVFLGYWVDKDEKQTIDFKITAPLTKKQSLILAAVIGVAVLAIILFFIFSK